MTTTTTRGALRRIALGFDGGQVLAARVDSNELAALRAAIEQQATWHELRAEDGAVLVSIGRLGYLLVDEDDGRIGFG
jgi:hypothetical protein